MSVTDGKHPWSSDPAFRSGSVHTGQCLNTHAKYHAGCTCTATERMDELSQRQRQAVATTHNPSSGTLAHDMMTLARVAAEHNPPGVKAMARPPLGLSPRTVALQQRVSQAERLEDILGAMSRYTRAGKRVPAGWIREFEDINAGLEP